MTKDNRQAVQERKIVRSESRWLQKALFALGKASEEQAKLARVRTEEFGPMTVTIEGEPYDMDTVTGAVKDAVLERVEVLRTMSREDRAIPL